MAARVALAGATGRMGQVLVQALLRCADQRLSAALCRPDNAERGQDAAAFVGQASGVLLADDVQAALRQADVVIDFTTPQASLVLLSACRELKIPMVIGTTGFDDAGRAAIQAAASEIGVVFAANMSVGVNLTMALLALAARVLPSDYDVEILEMHHRHKRDAPSGTALEMGEMIARERGTSLAATRSPAREGACGPRTPGAIGFAALRGGDVIGEHTAFFIGAGERIEISHRASSRHAYAEGALQASRFLLAQTPPGLYSMRDVLQLPPLTSQS